MRVHVLTVLVAKNLSAGKYADGQGLWLVKRSRQAGKWILRLAAQGQRREMGLGRWPDVSIAEARDKAADARRLWRDGNDPILDRLRTRRSSKPITLKQVIESCFEARKAELKGDGEAGRWMSPLTLHVIPKLGSYPVEEVDQHVLKELLTPIWHKKADTADKALTRIGIALKHAAALGIDVDLQATMKTRALLGKQRHVVKHIPSMPYGGAPAFYKWLLGQEGVSARALRFLILTVARTSEVRMASFSEIAGEIWTLPADRTKTGRARRIPLSSEAMSIVRHCKAEQEGDNLFPAYRGQPISDAAMSTLMKRQNFEYRPHGFRATFRTWVEEQTDTPFEVKESCLGHAVDTGVVGAYQRSDRLEKRRALLEQWERFLLEEG